MALLKGRRRTQENDLEGGLFAGVAVPELFYHLGPAGDLLDFVQDQERPAFARRLRSQQPSRFPLLFDPGPALERGFVRMEDRKGVMQDIPLVAISIGIASTAKRHFAHYGEAVAVATEMKSFAKRESGSSYAVDRRTEV